MQFLQHAVFHHADSRLARGYIDQNFFTHRLPQCLAAFIAAARENCRCKKSFCSCTAAFGKLNPCLPPAKACLELTPRSCPTCCDLACVWCFAAPPRASDRPRKGAYYAHPGNLFWRALFQAGLTPRLLAPAEFPLLPEFGIGLTDLAKRHSGNDDELPKDAFDVPGLLSKIETYSPGALAFTSKNAARAVLGSDLHYGRSTIAGHNPCLCAALTFGSSARSLEPCAVAGLGERHPANTPAWIIWPSKRRNVTQKLARH
jgi:G:T/U-mismatch repair DNA glycosylase